jgi:carbon-monoxide dehydrogenase large subunit
MPRSGLDELGHFLALHVSTRANLGAYVSSFGAAIAGPIYSALLAGLYRTPAVFVEVNGFFSNSVPTDAYRGAGRPEACYVLERLADKAALELGLDRAEIRRRNFIPPSAMPYKTPVGPTYDCGDFPRVFERALELADYAGFAKRKKPGRGIGIACYIESSGVAPSRLAATMGARVGFYETAQVRVAPDGSVTVFLGTHNHGQGHETTFAQILAQRLGVDFRAIRIVEGRHRRRPVGTGTFGSRSIAVGGSRAHAPAQDHRQGQAHRGAPPGGGRRDVEFARRVQRRRHRPRGELRRGARARLRRRTPIRSRRSSRAWTRPRSTIRRTSPSPTARTCASSRSIRETGAVAIVAISASTTSAP